MAKPDILTRLKNIDGTAGDEEIVVFTGSSGYKVKSSGLRFGSVMEIVSNNRNVLSHINNNKIHVTQAEKESITEAANKVNDHIADTTIHISAVDRATWNAKETEEGAQQKVNIAFSVANKHIQDKSLHVVSSDRLNWNNKYTREEIDNKFSQMQYDNVWKESVDVFEELASKYPSPQKGWTVTCNSDNITYRYDGTNWIPISANSIPLATIAVDGKMSKEDKAKLETVEMNANHYVHPDNPNVRHVTDGDKAYWSAKAEDRVASYQANGLMSKEDKYKLDSIEEGATNFVMPSELDPQIIKQDENHRFVTDKEKTDFANKANKNLATEQLDGLMSRYDKVKVNSIETNANYYVHPETHEATIIKQDPTHRFVSDEQILAWTNKAAAQLADAEHNGLMTKEDKAKLDGIAAGANNYHLPETLPPTIIKQDANNRFFTDQEREKLSLKKDMSAFVVGSGVFNGTEGTIINHSFGNTSFSVTITPTTNPNGQLGEYWVKKTNTLVVVYCSGAGKNIGFDYCLTYYN